jgi:GntR family transcriptional regulator, transcriptional repressor for pyruvate dehydrogenase complex
VGVADEGEGTMGVDTSEAAARRPGERMFARVSTGRISEEIVEQIKLAIRSGRLQPGDRLPAERELTERFGVSRVTVRDALRILESAGLVEIRVGARGGAFVRAPASSIVGEGIANLLMMSSLSPQEVTECRRIVEVGIVPLVCERATEEDLAVLEAICAESREAVRAGDYPVELSARFHVAFARAAHNGAVELLVESLRGPLLMSLMQAHERAPSMGTSGVREHVALVAAVRDRDVKRAQAILTRHLGRTARRLASSKRPSP